MTYNLKNTVFKGRPIEVELDGKVLTHTYYLDRRRRVIRKHATDEFGLVVFTATKVGVRPEEIRYSHKQKLVVREL